MLIMALLCLPCLRLLVPTFFLVRTVRDGVRCAHTAQLLLKTYSMSLPAPPFLLLLPSEALVVPRLSLLTLSLALSSAAAPARALLVSTEYLLHPQSPGPSTGAPSAIDTLFSVAKLALLLYKVAVNDNAAPSSGLLGAALESLANLAAGAQRRGTQRT